MSEIKVNKISPKQTCTTVTLGDSGDDFVVATGANLKTAAVKDTAGNVIVSRCGSNITIGSSGAAIALACGATQTGFGRTGTVDWDTTKITADPNPAVSGVGYFADTSSAAFTVTLPAAPSAGDIVAVQDYAGTWETNNLTLGRNGSNIGGVAVDVTLSTSNQSITLVYVDATRGWQTVNDSTQNVDGAQFIVATGGTITCCGDYKIHTFTGPGSFCVSCAGNACGSNTVDYLVVAGGGGAGGDLGAAGGAGGFRIGAVCSPGAPPLSAPGGLPVSATTYPITVGSGGAGNTGTGQGTSGSNSIFSTITSAGGGGGATAQGSDNPSTYQGGAGGNGAPVTGIFGVSPQPFYGPTNGVYAGGGGGGSYPGPGYATSPAPGGTGGGGPGSNTSGGAGTAGTANTGGGGGGGSCGNADGGAGGSGVVIIRYKYQ